MRSLPITEAAERQSKYQPGKRRHHSRVRRYRISRSRRGVFPMRL